MSFVSPGITVTLTPALTATAALLQQGPKGDTGATGASGGIPFAYAQSTASAVWTIVHGLGRYPSVTVIDSSGSAMYGEVHYQDLDTVIVTFSAPFGGEATLY